MNGNGAGSAWKVSRLTGVNVSGRQLAAIEPEDDNRWDHDLVETLAFESGQAWESMDCRGMGRRQTGVGPRLPDADVRAGVSTIDA